MKLKILLLNTTLLIVLFSNLAYAKTPNLVILPVQTDDIGLKSVYTNALVEGLRGDYVPYYGPEVEKKLQAQYDKEGCTQEACLQAVTIGGYNARMYAKLSLTPTMGDSTAIDFKITNIKTKQIVASYGNICEGCSQKELLQEIKQIGFKIKQNQNDASGTSGTSGLGGSLGVASLSVGIGELDIEVINPITTKSSTSNMASYSVTIILKTNQNNVDIYSKQTSIGKTNEKGNFKLRGVLSPNKEYILTLKKQGFLDKKVKFITKDGINDLGVIKLKSSYGRLNLQSRPSGGDVYIGGLKKGITPVIIDVIAGNYLISIKKDLYLDKSFSVKILPDKTTKDITILRPYYGMLYVSSKPKNALVSISSQDDIPIKYQRMSLKTPLKNLKLPPSNYKIKVHKQGYTSKEFNIKLGNQRTARIKAKEAKLRFRAGKALIDTKKLHNNAIIFVDGIEQGKAPKELSLSAGVHKLMIQTPNYQATQDIIINDLAEHEFVLQLLPRNFLDRYNWDFMFGFNSLQGIGGAFAFSTKSSQKWFSKNLEISSSTAKQTIQSDYRDYKLKQTIYSLSYKIYTNQKFSFGIGGAKIYNTIQSDIFEDIEAQSTQSFAFVDYVFRGDNMGFVKPYAKAYTQQEYLIDSYALSEKEKIKSSSYEIGLYLGLRF